MQVETFDPQKGRVFLVRGREVKRLSSNFMARVVNYREYEAYRRNLGQGPWNFNRILALASWLEENPNHGSKERIRKSLGGTFSNIYKMYDRLFGREGKFRVERYINWKKMVHWETEKKEGEDWVQSHPYTPSLLLPFLLGNLSILHPDLKKAAEQTRALFDLVAPDPARSPIERLLQYTQFTEKDQTEPGYLDAHPGHEAELTGEGQFLLMVYFGCLYVHLVEKGSSEVEGAWARLKQSVSENEWLKDRATDVGVSGAIGAAAGAAAGAYMGGSALTAAASVVGSSTIGAWATSLGMYANPLVGAGLGMMWMAGRYMKAKEGETLPAYKKRMEQVVHETFFRSTLGDLYAFTLMQQEKEFRRRYSNELVAYTLHLNPEYSMLGFLTKQQASMSRLSLRKWRAKAFCDVCPPDKKKFTETGWTKAELAMLAGVLVKGLVGVGAGTMAVAKGGFGGGVEAARNFAEGAGQYVGVGDATVLGGLAAQKAILTTGEGVCLTHDFLLDIGTSASTRNLFMRFVGTYEDFEKRLQALDKMYVRKEVKGRGRKMQYFIDRNILRMSMWVRQTLSLRDFQEEVPSSNLQRIREENSRVMRSVRLFVGETFYGVAGAVKEKLMKIVEVLVAISWLFFEQMIRHPLMKKAILWTLEEVGQRVCAKIRKNVIVRTGEGGVRLEEFDKDTGEWNEVGEKRRKEIRTARKEAQVRFRRETLQAFADLFLVFGGGWAKKAKGALDMLAFSEGGLSGFVKQFTKALETLVEGLPILKGVVKYLKETFFTGTMLTAFLGILGSAMQESLRPFLEANRNVMETIDMAKQAWYIVRPCFYSETIMLDGHELHEKFEGIYTRAWENALHNIPYRALQMCLMLCSLEEEKDLFELHFGLNGDAVEKMLGQGTPADRAWNLLVFWSDHGLVEVDAIAARTSKIESDIWEQLDRPTAEWYRDLYSTAGIVVAAGTGAYLLAPATVGFLATTFASMVGAAVGSISIANLLRAMQGGLAGFGNFKDLQARDKERFLTSLVSLGTFLRFPTGSSGKVIPLKQILGAVGGHRQVEYSLRFEEWVARFMKKGGPEKFEGKLYTMGPEGVKYTSRTLVQALLHRGLAYPRNSPVGEQLYDAGCGTVVSHKDQVKVDFPWGRIKVGQANVSPLYDEKRLKREGEIPHLRTQCEKQRVFWKKYKETRKFPKGMMVVVEEEKQRIPPFLRPMNMEEVQKFLNEYKGDLVQQVDPGPSLTSVLEDRRAFLRGEAEKKMGLRGSKKAEQKERAERNAEEKRIEAERDAEEKRIEQVLAKSREYGEKLRKTYTQVFKQKMGTHHGVFSGAFGVPLPR